MWIHADWIRFNFILFCSQFFSYFHLLLRPISMHTATEWWREADKWNENFFVVSWELRWKQSAGEYVSNLLIKRFCSFHPAIAFMKVRNYRRRFRKTSRTFKSRKTKASHLSRMLASRKFFQNFLHFTVVYCFVEKLWWTFSTETLLFLGCIGKWYLDTKVTLPTLARHNSSKLCLLKQAN